MNTIRTEGSMSQSLQNVDPSSRIGPGVRVDARARIGPNCHLVGQIELEQGVSLVGGITLVGDIHVARDARIEPGVSIAVMRPGIAVGSTLVKVGAGAHIGAGVVLSAGVSIGAGAWIEPGAVVSRNIPAYAIVGGNPAVISGYVEEAGQQPRKAPSMLQLGDVPGVHACQVGGVTVHHFSRIRDLRGDLTVGEFGRNLPFIPKRYFVVFDVPSFETRGEHAHKVCDQFLVCVAGSVSVVVDDGLRREEILLDRPNMGVYIPAGVWGIQYKYSRDGSLLVFASEYYDPTDYIRNYDDFLRFRGVQT
jgi:UDP-2-acetamido-3-amino-2,3-dideoxy-glucuronate N-acetyltransferase